MSELKGKQKGKEKNRRMEKQNRKKGIKKQKPNSVIYREQEKQGREKFNATNSPERK